MTDKPETFICAMCKDTFDKIRSDEDCDKECEELFGVKNGTSKVGIDCDIICDDCFQMIRPDVVVGEA